ncbi:hypothetical protein [Streptomyces sp. AC495_CC817]|uniref:hypothetical protein n=1 Tax=Streptomyces sp. AC495_CC817 TaxID=2823900 RepID=UPI001C2606DD|nr:hypothetical protein [Streptomyces sp. AC495_CC817]
MTDDADRAHADASPRLDGGIHHVVWRMWAVMPWLLPAFLCVSGMLVPGAAVPFFLAFSGVIVVPAAGIAGAFPRRMLRHRGAESASASVSWLLLLHWGSWVMLALSFTHQGWDGMPRSLLRTVSGVTLSVEAEHTVFIGAAIACVATWVGVVLMTLWARSVEPRRAWRTAAAWAALVVGPVLAVGSVWGAATATAHETDAAGETRIAASSRSSEEQHVLVEDRYERQQEALSTARAVIGPGVWAALPTVIDQEPGCGPAPKACYRIRIGYVFTPEGPVDVEEVRAAVAGAGWTEFEAPSAAEAGALLSAAEDTGGLLEFSDYSNGSYTLTLESPAWWISPEVFDEVATGEQVGVPDRLYAPDEWPELG